MGKCTAKKTSPDLILKLKKVLEQDKLALSSKTASKSKEEHLNALTFEDESQYSKYQENMLYQKWLKEALSNQDFAQDIEFRKKLTEKLFDFTRYWAVFIMIFLLISGAICPLLHWSDNVIMTLLGSSTATIIGLFAIVTKHFFAGKE